MFVKGLVSAFQVCWPMACTHLNLLVLWNASCTYRNICILFVGALLPPMQFTLLIWNVIDLANVHRHVDSEELISANMPLWPLNSVDDSEGKGAEAMSPFHQLDDVKCSECRVVFEKASEKRKRNSQKPFGETVVKECEDVAVWVYVQAEK